ncbi:MAG: porphobilinogen deaminase [Claussenomyces sp. TS43310]|nr:MAG: porphobilinogen deaminase [Claussenomyces sp. TS43310]
MDPTVSIQSESSKEAAPSTALKSRSDASTGSMTINIGTRRSALAVIQAEIFRDLIEAAHPSYNYEIYPMATMGDKNQVTPLHTFGAKALWTHELEASLLDGQLDLIVHCVKDMPTQLPPNCTIGCMLNRADPRDALIVKYGLPYKSLADLPDGSIVGTSSVRRSAQIANKYPRLKFKNVRGNVGTRLSKLDAEDGDYTCLILAAAGLERMDWSHRITQYLDSKTPGGGLLYAVGQGALAVEIREGDQRTMDLLEPLIEKPVSLACLAERSLLRTLEGGCSVPIGVETEWVETGKMLMRAIVVSLDGKESVQVERLGEVTNNAEADEFGWTVAQDLVKKGATEILEAINLNRKVIEEQGGA